MSSPSRLQILPTSSRTPEQQRRTWNSRLAGRQDLLDLFAMWTAMRPDPLRNHPRQRSRRRCSSPFCWCPSRSDRCALRCDLFWSRQSLDGSVVSRTLPEGRNDTVANHHRSAPEKSDPIRPMRSGCRHGGAASQEPCQTKSLVPAPTAAHAPATIVGSERRPRRRFL
jgi:hypothetical protein